MRETSVPLQRRLVLLTRRPSCRWRRGGDPLSTAVDAELQRSTGVLTEILRRKN